MYHVIIIEDDPMVASINRQYLAQSPQFSLEGCFSNGTDALAYLIEHPVDLAIVDYYMPMMNGMEFIRACHARHIPTAIIMITAASNTGEVMEVLANGVLDYIVKPFTYDRFQQALQKFLQIKPLRDQRNIKLSQDEVDRLLTRQIAGNRYPDQPIKGIQFKTLEMLKAYLQSHSENYLTSDEIAKAVHLSRITVRRYLNYLLENHEIVSRMDYTTGGRPSLRYCIKVRS